MREYALVLVAAAAVTYLLTPLARRFAVRVGALASVRDRDVHAIPTPRFGGLAMYAGLLAALVVAGHLPALGQVFTTSSEPRAIAVAGGLICLLGAIDDRWPLDALTKLAGQIAAAGVMVIQGVQLSFVTVPGLGDYSLDQNTAVPLTVLLAVLLINAVNFVDGLDGLAAGVIGIAALATFAYSYELSSSYHVSVAAPAAVLSVALAGICLGFLPHNFNPARLFMGDSGSMLLGLLLAAATTSVTGQVPLSSIANASPLPPLLVPLAVPAAVIAVPFVDLLLAVVRRTRARRSPFSPDKLHLHHRLLEIGHSHTRAVLLMYLWAAVIGFGGVALSFTRGPAVVASVVGALAVIATVASARPRLRAARERGGAA